MSRQRITFWLAEEFLFVLCFQNPRPQESRAVFSGSVSIPSITKSRPEPGRSMSASSGLSASKCRPGVPRTPCPAVASPTRARSRGGLGSTRAGSWGENFQWRKPSRAPFELTVPPGDGHFVPQAVVIEALKEINGPPTLEV